MPDMDPVGNEITTNHQFITPMTCRVLLPWVKDRRWEEELEGLRHEALQDSWAMKFVDFLLQKKYNLYIYIFFLNIYIYMICKS